MASQDLSSGFKLDGQTFGTKRTRVFRRFGESACLIRSTLTNDDILLMKNHLCCYFMRSLVLIGVSFLLSLPKGYTLSGESCKEPSWQLQWPQRDPFLVAHCALKRHRRSTASISGPYVMSLAEVARSSFISPYASSSAAILPVLEKSLPSAFLPLLNPGRGSPSGSLRRYRPSVLPQVGNWEHDWQTALAFTPRPPRFFAASWLFLPCHHRRFPP